MQVPESGMETASPEQDPYIREQQSQMLPVTPAVSKLTIPASRPLPPVGYDETPEEADRAKTVGLTTAAESLTPVEQREHIQAVFEGEKQERVQGVAQVELERQKEQVEFIDEDSGVERRQITTREKTLKFELEKYVGFYVNLKILPFTMKEQLQCHHTSNGIKVHLTVTHEVATFYSFFTK